jgi:hypothetical protein
MNTATGDFDAAVQITQPALARVLAAMHRVGAAAHAGDAVADGHITEVLLNVPGLALDPAGAADGTVAVSAASRVLSHKRPAENPAEVGLNAASDLTIRARAGVVNGGTPLGNIDPTPITPSSYLLTDYHATTAADIAVRQTPAGSDAEVTADLLSFAREQGTTLPLDFLQATGIVEVGAAVVDPGTGDPVVTIGANFAADPGASSASLDTSCCQQDWALAFSAEYLIDQLLARLDTELGALPPPYGPGPVLVDSSGGAETYLDTFVVTLTPGAIEVTGDVRRTAPGLFGTVTASWSAKITLALGPNQNIVTTVNEPAVTLHEWYAVVGNFVSGGRIATAVAEVLRDQLTGGLAGAGLDSLVSGTVGLVAARGTIEHIPVTIRATALEVRPDAVVLHGTVTAATPPDPPHAALVALQGNDPSRLTLHAGGSWAPGGQLSSIAYSFGDGSSQTHTGADAVLAAEHSYAPGQYSACVTVTDQGGRTATTCVAVQPGTLVVELLDSPNWEFCKTKPTLVFTVTSSGSGIRGAAVTVSGVSWSLAADTDTHGVALITVDPAQVEHAGLQQAKPSPYHLGAVQVTVTKPGWIGRQNLMWMVDCDSLAATRLAALERRREILDRLAGYAALKDLIAKYGKGTPDIDTLLGGFEPPPNPRDGGRQQIEQAIDVLTRIESLITRGGDVLPAGAILGIDPDHPEPNAAIADRLGELWTGIGEAGDRYNQRYGPGGDHKP